MKHANVENRVCIRTFHRRREADVAQSVLAACGIDADVRADDAGGMSSGLIFGGGGVGLYVRRRDAERANAILDRDQSHPRP